MEANPHSAADVVLAAARESLGGVSTQAVYDVLQALTEARLLRRIEPAGSPMLYETRVGDNHHHLVCRSCGAVVDVPCQTDSVPCATPDDEHGFDLDEAEITFWGRCADCRASSRADSATPAHSRIDSHPNPKARHP